MKFDFRESLTTSQNRTTTMVVNALLELLSKKKMEDITVRELCERSMIPRSTFYDYYDDKFDVIHWSLCRACYERYPEMDEKINHYTNVDKVADLICDFAEEYKPMIAKIAAKNPQNGVLYLQVRRCVADILGVIVSNCTSGKQYEYPYEVVFNMYVNGFLEIFNQMFYEKKEYSREQIHNYMNEMYVN